MKFNAIELDNTRVSHGIHLASIGSKSTSKLNQKDISVPQSRPVERPAERLRGCCFPRDESSIASVSYVTKHTDAC